ncbi:MAG: hypothetical protein H8K08_03150 [Nitrospira sp.]|nr:hypothetical protein [Nitrospira sp.]
MNHDFVTRRINNGDFRFLLISEIRRLMIEARQRAELAQNGNYVGREVTFLIRRQTLAEANSELVQVALTAAKAIPSLSAVADNAIHLAQATIDARDSRALLTILDQIFLTFGLPGTSAGDNSINIGAGDGSVKIKISDDGARPLPMEESGTDLLRNAVRAAHDDSRFLAVVAHRMATARREKRTLTGVERVALVAGYHAVEGGSAMPPGFRPIATSGFRPHQTNLSLADPGDGHVSVTCLSDALLDGTVIHVEHIDRSESNDRESIEAYRLPAFINAARVRLQTGVGAPCTAYIGRPLFENGVVTHDERQVLLARNYDRDLLKSVHMTAGACTAMFALGIADCKVAMERMSSSQLIRFMKAVSGNVIRDNARQFLSAAFNINVPILDDRDPAKPIWITDKFAIASLALELALVGQFEKVTWDGASNLEKSEPIILQFTHGQWVTLIHRAHENGLETYMSAGMNAIHMPNCVMTGVDGVGIGTSMHYTSPNRPMGQLRPEAIQEVLVARNETAASVPGQAAAMLAALDRLAYERILPTTLNDERQGLYVELRDFNSGGDEANLLTRLANIRKTSFWSAMDLLRQRSFDLHPVIARAQRFILAGKQAGGDRLEAQVAEIGRGIDAVRHALAAHDITELMEILR